MKCLLYIKSCAEQNAKIYEVFNLYTITDVDRVLDKMYNLYTVTDVVRVLNKMQNV